MPFTDQPYKEFQGSVAGGHNGNQSRIRMDHLKKRKLEEDVTNIITESKDLAESEHHSPQKVVKLGSETCHSSAVRNKSTSVLSDNKCETKKDVQQEVVKCLSVVKNKKPLTKVSKETKPKVSSDSVKGQKDLKGKDQRPVKRSKVSRECAMSDEDISQPRSSVFVESNSSGVSKRCRKPRTSTGSGYVAKNQVKDASTSDFLTSKKPKTLSTIPKSQKCSKSFAKLPKLTSKTGLKSATLKPSQKQLPGAWPQGSKKKNVMNEEKGGSTKHAKTKASASLNQLTDKRQSKCIFKKRSKLNHGSLPATVSKNFGFWRGPRLRRMASLNAQAKVHILYENEARSLSSDEQHDLDSDPTSSSASNSPSMVHSPTSKDHGRGMATSAPSAIARVSSSYSELTKSESKRLSSKDCGTKNKSSLMKKPQQHHCLVKKCQSVKSRLQESNRSVKSSKQQQHHQVKDCGSIPEVAPKRMASLNAQAILAASYSPIERPRCKDKGKTNHGQRESLTVVGKTSHISHLSVSRTDTVTQVINTVAKELSSGDSVCIGNSSITVKATEKRLLPGGVELQPSDNRTSHSYISRKAVEIIQCPTVLSDSCKSPVPEIVEPKKKKPIMADDVIVTSDGPIISLEIAKNCVISADIPDNRKEKKEGFYQEVCEQDKDDLEEALDMVKAVVATDLQTPGVVSSDKILVKTEAVRRDKIEDKAEVTITGMYINPVTNTSESFCISRIHTYKQASSTLSYSPMQPPLPTTVGGSVASVHVGIGPQSQSRQGPPSAATAPATVIPSQNQPPPQPQPGAPSLHRSMVTAPAGTGLLHGGHVATAAGHLHGGATTICPYSTTAQQCGIPGVPLVDVSLSRHYGSAFTVPHYGHHGALPYTHGK